MGIVRVSGPKLESLIERLAGRPLTPRQATRLSIRDADGELIDDGLALYFRAPSSFTGEDVLELQGHGSPIVLAGVLSRCLEVGARLARPGEFSERAFLNGKLDLVQAEAIADLIDASTASAARSAMQSLAGAFSAAIAGVAAEMVHLRMLTEATLDFSDEEVDSLTPSQAAAALDRLDSRVAAVNAEAERGRVLRDGMTVVLIGRPNVGKSSLLNRLAGDDIAIVSEHAGTTRDSLKSVVQVRGLPLHIVDTAGLRPTDDPVERIGIERTWQQIRRADLALVVADAGSGVQDDDRVLIAQLPPGLRVLTVLNKLDLAGDARAGDQEIAVSAKTGQGMERLEQLLLDQAHWHPGEGSFSARTRHLDALRRCARHLTAARTHTTALELFAEELRLAHRALQEITGEFSTEDLLGEIFSGFCIGK